jgi:hypothetical protein
MSRPRPVCKLCGSERDPVARARQRQRLRVRQWRRALSPAAKRKRAQWQRAYRRRRLVGRS